jgi:hypothetical protein
MARDNGRRTLGLARFAGPDASGSKGACPRRSQRDSQLSKQRKADSPIENRKSKIIESPYLGLGEVQRGRMAGALGECRRYLARSGIIGRL